MTSEPRRPLAPPLNAALTKLSVEKIVPVFPNPEPVRSFPASDLIASGVAVIYCFRRPGSGLCREEAEKAYARVIEMKAAGATRVVALIKEDIGTEVEDFKKFWPGDIFVDSEMAFYKALGGGEFHAPLNNFTYYAMLANPWSKNPARKRLAKNSEMGYTSTMNGEDFIHGGVYVITPDGAAVYSFLEQDMGDMAPITEVIRACKEAGTFSGTVSRTSSRTATVATVPTAMQAGAMIPAVGTATTHTMTQGTARPGPLGTTTTRSFTQGSAPPPRTRTGTK